MADINSIPSSPSSSPSQQRNNITAVDIVSGQLGQRIEKTTEGVSATTQGSSTGAAAGKTNVSSSQKASRKTESMPESEEALRADIRKALEDEKEEVRDEIKQLQKQGGKGMAYHITLKVTQLRQIHATIMSLYEITRNKLEELYKNIFKIS